MRSTHILAMRRSRSVCAVLLVALFTALVAAAPAVALSGRVGPQRATEVRAGTLPARLASAAGVDFGIWDAQATGALVYSMANTTPSTTLMATDGAGATVWSVAAGDVWAASGTLPAALVATFTNPNPNVLRDGRLTAYDASGKVTFQKSFKREFVQPLADTAKRLVWVETTAKAVTRVYVRQGGKTRSVALPYVPPKAQFLSFAAASDNGRRVLVGERLPRAINGSLEMTYWVSVDPGGTPQVVSHHVTQWVGAALTPSGDKAAIMTHESIGGIGNLWVSFGRFAGPEFGGEAAGYVYASATGIFEQGGYLYQGETVSWGTTSVNVFDRSLMPRYQRAWTFNDATSSIWFSHDRELRYLAGTTNAGAVTAINVESWAIQPVPGTYAAAVPVDDGRLATMTTEGVFSYVANPVAGP